MFSALHITLHPTFIYGSNYTGHTGPQKMQIKRQERGGGLMVIAKDWSVYAFSENFACFAVYLQRVSGNDCWSCCVDWNGGYSAS